MDDKLKIFWNLDVLVKMCRSKSDGPSLRIEEEEIVEKIESYNLEIEEIKSLSEEDSYDTSAEMADRNIEIITKRQLQTLRNLLKEKNKELNVLKSEEQNLYANNSLLRENKNSQEKYILSMQERINEATDYEVIDRYNGLIAETTEKISTLVDELEEQTESYEKVQQAIIDLSAEISNIEDKIDKKKKLLSETQANLENKDNYIDKSKKEKMEKKIAELEQKIQKASARLEEIQKDPKYLESKIKEIINNKENIEKSKPYLINLINTAIKVPYINVPADNALEEELLKATQARDSFANEIEQKSYNILETNTPEKVRIEFLNERIALWSSELDDLKTKVEAIDRDREYNYESKNQTLQTMIQTMKEDLKEFEKAYAQVPDMSVSAKVSIKAAMDEKRVDILEAEKIVTAFRKDESNDIARATKTIKYECDRLYQNIQNAENEIETIKNRLTSKKSGLIDIGAKNKDKDILKELAQTVVDIKHRRQFPETPIDIVKRLESELDIKLLNEIDNNQIENSSNIVKKDYEEFNDSKKVNKRGLKVIEETEVETNIEDEDGASKAKAEEAQAELQSLINNIEEKEKNNTPIVEPIVREDMPIEEPSIEIEIPIVEEQPLVEEVTPTIEATPIEVEVPVVEEQPIIEQPLVEEVAPIIEATPIEVEVPVVEEQPIVEEPLVEEVAPIIEATPIEVEVPVVEEQPIVEQPLVEEVAPTIEATPIEVEVPVVEEQPIIEQPLVEETVQIVEPIIENTDVNQIITDEDDLVLDQQIDDIILSTKSDENDENQPLDIDAIFADTSSIETQPKTANKKLSIDTIFNVETDKIDSEDTSNENLANDFDQYINDLGNKEA